MRTLPALVFLLATIGLNGAILEWTPAASGSLVTGFKVYRSPAQPVPVWTLYGTTAATTFTVTNGGLYHVVSTNAYGDSIPSATVTNIFVPPDPPTVIIRASIESAPSPDGPWTVQATFPADVQLVGNQFYRGRLTVGNGGTSR